MRRICPVFLAFGGLLAVGQTAQKLPPVPADPLELATGPVHIPADADERAAAISLMERARQNFTLRSPGSAPYHLKVSFLASGSTNYTGSGEMEEWWGGGGRLRWTAHLGSYSETRVFPDGSAWDANPQAYIPLRLQQLRQTLLWPLNKIFTNAQLRVAPASWNGTQVNCVLVSFGAAPATAEPGRFWQEEEFCIDPASGLLQTYSAAPGIYNVYGYASAIRFHGRTVPRQLTVVVSGTPVLEAQSEISDLGNVDETMFQPQEGWSAPAIVIRGPQRFPMMMPQTSDNASPMIVHALISREGKVLEAEALQNSDAARAEAAVEFVRGRNFGEVENPIQREAFIRLVQMKPQTPSSSQ